MAERKGKKSQKKAEQVQEMPVLAKNKQDVLELGELDQYYFGEGTHYDIYKKLGAHIGYKNGKEGIYFAVWAPNAASVSVIGEFNGWQENACPMRRREPLGMYDAFVQKQKWEIFTNFTSGQRMDGNCTKQTRLPIIRRCVREMLPELRI